MENFTFLCIDILILRIFEPGDSCENDYYKKRST